MGFYDDLKSVKGLRPEIIQELEEMFALLPKKIQKQLLRRQAQQAKREKKK